MSLAEAETKTANVEPFRKPTQSGVPTQLQQFAKFGLTLNIVDFRAMCEELYKAGRFDTPHEVMDSLFAWMMERLNPDAK